MEKSFLSVNGIELPSPIEISVDDELIWSADTGRDLSGLFSGDVIAEKKTVSISWGILTATEIEIIKSNLVSGYFPLKFLDSSGYLVIESYRGTLSKTMLGYIGGTLYYKSASCKIVQR